MRKRKLIDKHEDWDYSSIAYCYTSIVVDKLKPTSYDEAKGINVWKDIIKKKILAFKKNETRDFVSLWSGVSPTSCKWVHKVKRKSDC